MNVAGGDTSRDERCAQHPVTYHDGSEVTSTVSIQSTRWIIQIHAIFKYACAVNRQHVCMCMCGWLAGGAVEIKTFSKTLILFIKNVMSR